MKKTWELINKNYDAVIIKEFLNGYNRFLELSVEFNYSTLKIEKTNYRILTHEKDPLARWTSKPLDYIGETALKDACKMIKSNMRQLKENLITGKNHPIYAMMAEYVGQIVRHYHTDFTFHDTIQLAKHDNSIKFIWIVRECGTHLFYGQDSWSLAIFENQIKSNETAICFYYDGNKLNNVSLQEGKELLDKMKYTFIS